LAFKSKKFIFFKFFKKKDDTKNAKLIKK